MLPGKLWKSLSCSRNGLVGIVECGQKSISNMDILRKTGELLCDLFKISNCSLNAETKRLHPVVESSLNAHRRNTFVLLSQGKALSLIQAVLFSVSGLNYEDFTGAPAVLLRRACSKVFRCLVPAFKTWFQ